MIIALIPAKGESNRLADKNMQLVCGKPMIYFSIKAAKESRLIEKIYVSTDSNVIASYASSQGVEVIQRGHELAGETPVAEVYRHALEVLSDPLIEYVVAIQPDHPDRTIQLDHAINYALDKGYDDVLTVDGKGSVNGSVRIMKADALSNGRIGAVGTLMDDCTNVHYMDDLRAAEANLFRRENEWKE